MPRTTRHRLTVLLAAGLIFFTNLGGASLFDEDEAKNAECGREMFVRGDAVVPTFNDELRTDKPILSYWLMLAAYRVFGVNEFAARFFSALLSVGTVLLTYQLGRRLFSRDAGYWASLVLASSLLFAAVGRAATPDPVLIFCTTLSLALYVRTVGGRVDGSFAAAAPAAEGNPQPIASAFTPRTWIGWAPVYLAMGLAVLAKGPVGVLLPCAVIGLFLLAMIETHMPSPPAEGPRWQRWIAGVRRFWSPSRFRQACRSMRLGTAATIVLAVAAPWYALVSLRTQGRWLAGFLGDHNLGRFAAAMEGHDGSLFYYVPAILAGFFPWSILLPVGLFELARQIRRGGPQRDACLFVSCWCGVYLVFFSLAGTKLPNYVLPLYPALALITGLYLQRWLESQHDAGGGVFRLACRTLAGLGFLIAAGVVVAAHILMPGEELLAAAASIPVAGAAAAYWHIARGRRRTAARIWVWAAVGLAVVVVGLAPLRVSRHQNSNFFAEAARQAGPGRLATFDYFAPSLVFYTEQMVHRFDEPGEVRAYFADRRNRYLLTRADKLARIESALPERVRIAARRRRFLRRHDLVLLDAGSERSHFGTARDLASERPPERF